MKKLKSIPLFFALFFVNLTYAMQQDDPIISSEDPSLIPSSIPISPPPSYSQVGNLANKAADELYKACAKPSRENLKMIRTYCRDAFEEYRNQSAKGLTSEKWNEVVTATSEPEETGAREKLFIKIASEYCKKMKVRVDNYQMGACALFTSQVFLLILLSFHIIVECVNNPYGKGA